MNDEKNGKFYALHVENAQQGKGKHLTEAKRVELLADIEKMVSDGLVELQYWVHSGDKQALDDARDFFLGIWEKVMCDEVTDCKFSSGATLIQRRNP